jgi:hypothetical protein
MSDIVANHRVDHGEFCVWKYNGPGKKARGFWHGNDPVLVPMWAYALKAPMPGQPGQFFWETSRAKGGFVDENAAIVAAQIAVARRHRGE